MRRYAPLLLAVMGCIGTARATMAQRYGFNGYRGIIYDLTH